MMFALPTLGLVAAMSRRRAVVGATAYDQGRANAPAPKRAAATGGFMSDRTEFEIVCPNNHNQTVSFTQEEFEGALKSDTLVFHCNTCDTDWTPSSEEVAKLRKQLSKDAG
jgi:hypothetical protein